MHFRRGRRERSEFQFRIGDNIYIGIYGPLQISWVLFLREKNDFTQNAENLARGAGRALGSVISKFQTLKEFGINTYEKL